MTNHFSFCRNYSDPLGYCLQDKRLQQEQAPELEGGKKQVKNRAEVLYYHQCYGNEQELIRQFKEVQKQNFCLSQPAFHLSLNLPPGDKITDGKFVDIVKDCAKAMDFEQHQYVVIRHKDTDHPHIHIVVNRVGPDNHTMEDHLVLKRITRFCKAMEQKHQLTQTNEIRLYRKPGEQLKQQNQRVVKLQENIRQTLERVDNLDAFTAGMAERGYKVYRYDKGIGFKDSDGVFTGGYKADYPWKKVEAALAQNLAERLAQEQRLEEERLPRQVQRRGLRMRM